MAYKQITNFIPKRPLRILHAPVNSAGQAFLISRAQRKLGLKSDVIVFYQKVWQYPVDKNLDLKSKFVVYRELVMLINFIRCLFRYDVFHFHCGLSLLPFNLDVPILKFFRKKVIMQYWGSDVIQTDVARKIYLWTPEELENLYPDLDNSKIRRKIAHQTKIFNRTIVGDPSGLSFSPKSSIIRSSVDLEKCSFIKFHQHDCPLIVHPPTNRIVKGTNDILAVIEDLKRDGHRFKFTLIEKVPHTEALEIYKKADIVVDEIRQGPYGTLALECLALGKPVICRRDKRLNQFFRDCPIVNADKDTLYAALKKLIQNPKLRTELGIKGRKYVERHHDSLKIARQFVELYNSLFYKIEDFAIISVKDTELPFVNEPLYKINPKYPVDKDGFVLFRYRDNNYYHPVQVAEKIFYFLNKKNLVWAEKYAQKLIELSYDSGSALFFPYPFDFYLHRLPWEKMTAPWFSGMAQGEILSVFTKLYKITKKSKYRRLAQRTFQSFLYFYKTHKPWITCVDDGFLWFEEYPQEHFNHTLNGFIYALFGLYEYFLLTQDSQAKKLLQAGLMTIKYQIDKFRQKDDLSLYCLKHRWKSPHYHEVHINQLRFLFKITGDGYFQEMADKLYNDFH